MGSVCLSYGKILYFLYKLSISIIISGDEASYFLEILGERGGSVVECRTPEREVRGSRPTSAVLCP